MNLFCKDCKVVFSSTKKPYQHKCSEYNRKLVTRSLSVKFKKCRGNHSGPCIRTAFENEIQRARNRTVQSHTCNFCLKTFSKHSNLKRHLSGHFSNPFKCRLCPKEFSQKYTQMTNDSSVITATNRFLARSIFRNIVGYTPE